MELSGGESTPQTAANILAFMRVTFLFLILRNCQMFSSIIGSDLWRFITEASKRHWEIFHYLGIRDNISDLDIIEKIPYVPSGLLP